MGCLVRVVRYYTIVKERYTLAGNGANEAAITNTAPALMDSRGSLCTSEVH
jgi:hypothetical protein